MKIIIICCLILFFLHFFFFPLPLLIQSQLATNVIKDEFDGDIPLQHMPSTWQDSPDTKSSTVVAMDDEWEIHPRQVVVETRLGQGAYGDVYTGVVMNGGMAGGKKALGGQNSVAIQILPCKKLLSVNQIFIPRYIV